MIRIDINTSGKRVSGMLLAMLLVVAVHAGSPVNKSPEDSSKGPAFSLSSGSTLAWQGFKRAGGHHGIVEVVEGNIFTDEGSITGGSFAIDMRTIVCHDIRSKGMNKLLVDHLKSDDFFSVEQFPFAKFTIFSVSEMTPVEKGEIIATHMVSGDLEIKDITRRISFPAEIEIRGDKVLARSGEIVINRLSWNISNMSESFFAGLRDNYVDEEFKVSLDLVFDVN